MNSILNTNNENILFLNYNTILFQSMGFIELMRPDLESNEFYSLSQEKIMNILLNITLKNPTKLIDSTITDEDYFNFINKKFSSISYISPVTNLYSIATILSRQIFTNKVHIASPSSFGGDHIYNNCIHSFFDIFNASKIKEFINKNNITTVFLHDISLVYDLIFNHNTDVKGMTFVISRLGYNFGKIDNVIESLYPKLSEAQNKLKFDLAYINLFETENPDSKLFSQ